jgi:anti-repressor protein
MSQIYPDFAYNNPIQRGEIFLSTYIGEGYLEKLRPVVVIQNDIGNKHSRSIIVAAITSKPKKELPVNVVIDPTKYSLEVENCTIMANQIFTIDKDYLRFKKGCLDAEDLRRLDDALMASFDLKNQEVKGMNELTKIFDYQGSQVRTVLKDGEPWFVSKDVCDILELDLTQIRRLDEDEKDLYSIQTPGGKQAVSVVNESGLYNLVLGSRKPEAKAFKRWITHEVIPQIRKTGSYFPTSKNELIAAGYKAALELIEEMKPKAEQYDKFISGENYQNMNTVAKALGYGRNRLFKTLRDRKILMANNTPYQQYLDAGYFVVKEKPIQMGEQVIDKPQTYCTSKGIAWLSEMLN